MSQGPVEECRRQKTLLQENQDPVQECPAKRPRHLESVAQSPAAKAHAAPDTAKKEQDDAAAAPDTGKQEQHDPPAAEHAESHGSLSQDTLRMGAGSPVVQDTDEA